MDVMTEQRFDAIDKQLSRIEAQNNLILDTMDQLMTASTNQSKDAEEVLEAFQAKRRSMR